MVWLVLKIRVRAEKCYRIDARWLWQCTLPTKKREILMDIMMNIWKVYYFGNVACVILVTWPALASPPPRDLVSGTLSARDSLQGHKSSYPTLFLHSSPFRIHPPTPPLVCRLLTFLI